MILKDRFAIAKRVASAHVHSFIFAAAAAAAV